jgi:hypothetical protein
MIRSLGRMIKKSFNYVPYLRMHFQDVAAGRKLLLQQDNLSLIGASDILLFSRLDDKNHHMSFFVDYYRKLGVRHFMFVNASPTGELPDWTRNSDITVWRTAETEGSEFDIRWMNDLLRRYGIGHWNLVVDPHEYFIYPNMETRGLKALVSFLEEERRQSMHAVVLDAYGESLPDKGAFDQSGNPFEIWPLFDRDGYIQAPGQENSTIIKGGPRMRLEHRTYPGRSPNLARIPLVKWKRHFHFKSSRAAALPRLLNRAHNPGYISPSGALISFNWIADRCQENSANWSIDDLVQETLSVSYRDFRQLQDLGLISPGRWF